MLFNIDSSCCQNHSLTGGNSSLEQDNENITKQILEEEHVTDKHKQYHDSVRNE